MKIELKDRNSQETLQFKGLRVSSIISEPKQVFISFSFILNLKSVEGIFELDSELSDLEEMLENLISLRDSPTRVFFFQHSDERIKIKFSPDANGRIEISGYVYDESFDQKVSFKIELDQSQLSDIISECENTIKNLS